MRYPEPPEEDDPLVAVPVGGGAAPEAVPAPVDHRPPAPDDEFSGFYRTYFTRLTTYLLYQGAPVHLAAELAQETMIKAYRRWAEIRFHRSWAYKVAYQAYIRHAVRVEEEPVGEVPEPTTVLSRLGEAEAWVQEREIVRLLSALPARQRQVLGLTLDGWTPADIGELLGVDGATVRANLLKARRAAARYLDARGEG
ncbi:RNA polymerase sigma factor [Streptomyces cylindrosporus]|uniref:Sigma-70 family RNA polymerase sigma factor n=1 Tax=Streptomyces cylindrosporus TaxID=2927583 RepID=A0ABS9YP02_9ACTN|nr:sigma-70 family RNA polymerase sigma factor [Streptomyces cylindrosporus]MCI3278942.1 sigma-70 family RNA polymerase sigma factor [Streptomyces cylindrosporus]